MDNTKTNPGRMASPFIHCSLVIINPPSDRCVVVLSAKPLFLAVLFALALGGFVHGQTAAEMDALLDTPEITWAQACRFVLPASGTLEAHAGSGAAFAAALERGWLPKGAAAGSPARLGGLSFLISNAFSIHDSVLYALFPEPRYAYRQLDYLGLIPGLRDPAMKVSGERLAQILGRVLDYRGDGEPDAPAEPAGRDYGSGLRE
ncbi:MAG: hypothetical protein LBF77_03970 [Spirochaetaceae bacterium]|nr:hypothetical protein [Spirochaetaceae bacterium]